MNLLVVDDEFFVAEGIADSIRYDNLELDEVFCAYSVKQAKKVFEEHPISILITDIEMPRENGFALLQWMKENAYTPQTILLTGHKKFEYAYEAVNYNCVQYLLKPVQQKELHAVLSKTIEKAQMESAYQKWFRQLSQEEIDRLEQTETRQNIILTIKRLVSTHLTSPQLNRTLLANEVHLNEDYLSYLFHKESGETLTAFIQKERINKAKILLRTTELSTEAIAEMVAFPNASYLRKVFKRWIGVSPGQYRKGGEDSHQD